MRPTVTTVALAASIALFQHLAAAESQSGRDRSSPPTAAPAGTASVAGVVRSADVAGQPIARATVSLLSSDLRVPLSTVTDDGGRFTFTGVPAGHFNLVASKPAHVGAFYGGRRPGRGPGTPIAVRDGDQIDGLDLTLPRGGVVTGTVRLPSSLPAQGMTVVVVGVDGVGEGRRLRLAGGRAVTDDRGQYRVFGLPPGNYLVQVQPSGFIAGAPTGATDAPVTTPAEVSWIEQTTSNARRGLGAPAASTTEPPRGTTRNYARVYFPGTPDVSGARVVTLDLGDVRDGIDVDMVLTPTAAVSGTVRGPDGAPVPGAEVTLRESDDALDAVAIIAPLAPVRSADDGTFTIRAVPPGRYRLLASTAAPTGRGRGAAGRGAGGARGRGMAPAGADASALWADQDLAVDGRNVDGLGLDLRPGMTVRGRLVFQAAATPPDGATLAQARIALRPDDPTNGVVGVRARSANASVNADGTFEVTGLAPGAYRIGVTMPGLRLTASSPAGGWSLRSIVVGRDIDALDRPIAIRPGQDVDDVVATLTDRPTTLTGSLTDETGRPAPGYPIVVFSTDRRDWFHGSRRIAVARPATDGTFQLVGLPAGTYHASGLVDVDPADLGDPTFLDLLVPGAVALRLTDGEPTVQHLRLSRGR